MQEFEALGFEITGFEDIDRLSLFCDKDSPFSVTAELIALSFKEMEGLSGRHAEFDRAAFYLAGDPIGTIKGFLAQGTPIPIDIESIQAERQDDQIHCFARLDGYLGFDGSMKIFSPLRNQENYEIVFRNIPVRWGIESLRSWIAYYCKHHRERYFNPAVEVLSPEEAKELICDKPMEHYVVKGIRPQEGKDGRIEVFVKPDTLPADSPGGVDYKSIHSYTVCEENQLLATLWKSSEGVAGVDIYGDPIAVAPGKALEYKGGANIRAEETPDRIQFYAAIGGLVHLGERDISVSEVMMVPKDVDYSTGNIVYQRDVVIKGSVKSGFSLHTGGNLIVHGALEAGVKVDCAGNLTVLGGVIGKDTSIKCMGTAVIGYVQDARIYCQGPLTIEKGCLGGHIFSGASIYIHGKGVKDEKQALVGGSCRAMEEVVSPSVGSPFQDTFIALGYNPFAEKSLETISEAIRALDLHISRVAEKLGQNRDVAILRNNIGTMTPGQKKSLVKQLQSIKEANQKKEALLKQRELRKGQVYQQDKNKMKVLVSKHLVPKVSVQLGTEQLDILTPLGGFELVLGDQGLEIIEKKKKLKRGSHG